MGAPLDLDLLGGLIRVYRVLFWVPGVLVAPWACQLMKRLGNVFKMYIEGGSKHEWSF